MEYMSIEDLKSAFRKVLSLAYFEKNDLELRRKVAEFTRRLEKIEDEDRIFEVIRKVASGEDEDVLKTWLDRIAFRFYPKKIVESEKEKSVITNIPEETSIVERILVRTDIP